MEKIVSTCIYCGCGCKLTYNVENNKIVKIEPYKDDDISDGRPCIKGLTINEVFDKNRIKKPLIRKDNKLVEASWQEAIDMIYEIVKDVKPNKIFVNGSGKLTNEDNFLIYKFACCLLKTLNIDSCCGRLCHISTVKGLKDCLGVPNFTRVKHLDEIDVLFVIGSNPASNYPVFWNKVIKNKDKIKIISVQPLFNITSRFGDIFLELTPGSEVALINGIINYLIKENAFSEEAKNIEGFEKLKETVKKYDVDFVVKVCKVDKEKFLEACKIIANAKKLGVFHGMGFTQHVNSLANVHSLLNLMLLKDGHILTLRGEINVQGVGDVFSADVEILKKLWPEADKPYGNIIEALLINPVDVAFIFEFNPAQSLPYLNKVHENLKNMKVIYFGSYFNKTTEFADVILPIPALFESYGTITNGEQRIRLVNKPIKPEYSLLDIFKMLAKRFNKADLFNYKDEKEVFREICKCVEWYKGIDVEEVFRGKDAFASREIKYKRFYPEEFKGIDEERTKEFNFLLTTFREMHQFLTGEITSCSETLNKLDKDKLHLYINSDDAKMLGIKDEDKIRVSSKVGSIECLARITDKVPRGLLATRFHYKALLVNKLFPPEFDKETYTPNYKCCAVKVEKI